MESSFFAKSIVNNFNFLVEELKYKVISENKSENILFILLGNSELKRGVYIEYSIYDDFISFVILKYSDHVTSLDNYEDQVKLSDLIKHFGHKPNSFILRNMNFENVLKSAAYYMKQHCMSILSGSDWISVNNTTKILTTAYKLFNPNTCEWEQFESLDAFNKRLDELKWKN